MKMGGLEIPKTNLLGDASRYSTRTPFALAAVDPAVRAAVAKPGPHYEVVHDPAHATAASVHCALLRFRVCIT